jgi:hypothetical protein
MGINASPTCELQYNNTPAILIGKRRYGLLRYAMALMNGARLAVGAQALGIAEAAYREALSYAGERIQFGEPIMELPPVARMLLEMRAEIEASRALIAEAGRWVDLLKCYEIAQERLDETDPALRKKQRHASSMADILTPMTKYYASEMSIRVTNQALQVHGGVGYMKEFNIERHYRDARVTNIYEGTSQLQVVAALGKLLGHALDEQLDAWAAEDYGPELEDLREDLSESNQLFKIAIDSLKEQDRPVIDYYAGDLMDTASWLVNSWLMLDDGKEDERKRKLARIYVSTHVEDIHRAPKLIKAADGSAFEAREMLL